MVVRVKEAMILYHTSSPKSKIKKINKSKNKKE